MRQPRDIALRIGITVLIVFAVYRRRHLDQFVRRLVIRIIRCLTFGRYARFQKSLRRFVSRKENIL